jgi:hypothetical protein
MFDRGGGAKAWYRGLNFIDQEISGTRVAVSKKYKFQVSEMSVQIPTREAVAATLS